VADFHFAYIQRQSDQGARGGYALATAIEDLFNSADDDFFHRVKTNTNHVLRPQLPGNTDLPYQLRTRSHNMTLINKTKFLTSDDFFNPNAVQYSY